VCVLTLARLFYYYYYYELCILGMWQVWEDRPQVHSQGAPCGHYWHLVGDSGVLSDHLVHLHCPGVVARVRLHGVPERLSAQLLHLLVRVLLDLCRLGLRRPLSRPHIPLLLRRK